MRKPKGNPTRTADPYFPYAVALGLSALEMAEHFGIKHDESHMRAKDAPWNFYRFGTSATILDDGTCVFVAGEHEDYYHPDFCIYHDVVVAEPGGPIRVFLYPARKFPPTDFHTATRVDGDILLIGNLGYRSKRKECCQVYRLGLVDFAITKVTTDGNDPGWISRHKAAFDEERQRIVVWDIGFRNKQSVDSDEVYTLCCESFTWHFHGSI